MEGDSSGSRPPAGEELLLRQWLQGDEDAAQNLLERLRPEILRMVRSRLGPRVRRHVESGDVASESVLRLLAYVPRIEVADFEQFRRLIRRIVTNVIRDLAKRHGQECRDDAREQTLNTPSGLLLQHLENGQPTPSALAATAEERDRVHAAIAVLHETDQSVIIFRLFHGHSWDRIREELEFVSCDAARMRFGDALDRFEKALEKLDTGDLDQALSITLVAEENAD